MPLNRFKTLSRKQKLGLGLFVLVGTLALAYYFCAPWMHKTTAAIYHKIDELADTHPVFLVSTGFLLILFGLPVSFFYVLSVAVYGTNQALLINTAMLAVHLSLTYVMASYVLKGLLVRFLRKRGHNLKAIPPAMQTRVTVLLRAFPVVSVTLQNVLLALGGVPFKKYFWISWPFQCIWMVAIVLSSGSILEGNVGFGLAGLALLVALMFLTRMLKGKGRQQEVQL